MVFQLKIDMVEICCECI